MSENQEATFSNILTLLLMLKFSLLILTIPSYASVFVQYRRSTQEV